MLNKTKKNIKDFYEKHKVPIIFGAGAILYVMSKNAKLVTQNDQLRRANDGLNKENDTLNRENNELFRACVSPGSSAMRELYADAWAHKKS